MQDIRQNLERAVVLLNTDLVQKATREIRVAIAKIDGFPPQFEFTCLDHVYVIAHDLNYPGRVLSCKYSCDAMYYEVQYCMEGSLKVDWFFGDEIKLKGEVKNDNT